MINVVIVDYIIQLLVTLFTFEGFKTDTSVDLKVSSVHGIVFKHQCRLNPLLKIGGNFFLEKCKEIEILKRTLKMGILITVDISFYERYHDCTLYRHKRL